MMPPWRAMQEEKCFSKVSLNNIPWLREAGNEKCSVHLQPSSNPLSDLFQEQSSGFFFFFNTWIKDKLSNLKCILM